MRPLLPILILISCPGLPLISATPTQQTVCYRTPGCDTDAEAMRAAINLIPDYLPLLSSEEQQPSSSSTQQPPQSSIQPPGAYRIPAIFETSPLGQIYVRVVTASGLQLDSSATLMTYLWPQAKKAALALYGKCRMGESGSSAWAQSTNTWPGPPWVQLGFKIDMACHIDKRRLPEGMGIATYTPSGVESGLRIGAGNGFARGRGPV